VKYLIILPKRFACFVRWGETPDFCSALRGFGLPAVGSDGERRAVVVSNISSCLKIAGDAGELV